MCLFTVLSKWLNSADLDRTVYRQFESVYLTTTMVCDIDRVEQTSEKFHTFLLLKSLELFQLFSICKLQKQVTCVCVQFLAAFVNKTSLWTISLFLNSTVLVLLVHYIAQFFK